MNEVSKIKIEGGLPKITNTQEVSTCGRSDSAYGLTKFVTPPCDLCSDVSVVVIRAPRGCACLQNVYQRRCVQHLHRASDTLEDFEIVEDYTAKKVFSPNYS